MTVNEAAEKWGCAVETVRNMISSGRIQTTRERMGAGKKWRHNIPDDCPYPTHGGHNVDWRVAYIARNAGRCSVRHIAKHLGISCDEVREIFDKLVEMGRGFR